MPRPMQQSGLLIEGEQNLALGGQRPSPLVSCRVPTLQLQRQSCVTHACRCPDVDEGKNSSQNVTMESKHAITTVTVEMNPSQRGIHFLRIHLHAM
jgi:hypothetical protein